MLCVCVCETVVCGYVVCSVLLQKSEEAFTAQSILCMCFSFISLVFYSLRKMFVSPIVITGTIVSNNVGRRKYEYYHKCYSTYVVNRVLKRIVHFGECI